MARPRSQYVCQSCGASVPRWEGQCRTCGSWNSLVETVIGPSPTRRRRPAGPADASTPEPLRHLGREPAPRRRTGIAELDRVLGGGLVPGSLVLLGGEPGIGKSTLVLQAAAGILAIPGAGGATVLYASGEESGDQVRLRADRLGLLDGPAGDTIRVVSEHDVGRIADLVRDERPVLLVVDSIQTATVEDLEGPAGSVGQVREAAVRLLDLAKTSGVAVVLVGHVTKDGTLAGPKTLEHLVDAVLTLEGDRAASLRLLRVPKNRFAPTDEVGVFEMAEHGLAEVGDPSRAFLVEHRGPAAGSVVAPILEGTRTLLVEIQALVAPGSAGPPRRTVSGVDPNRLALLIAVLARRAGVGIGSQDVYANVVGGLSVDEPGLDLPLALALASSLRDRPVRAGTVAVGEVGLLGELRSVGGMDRRLREAARLGFRRAIVPVDDRPGRREERDGPAGTGLEVVAVTDLREAIEAGLERAPTRAAPGPGRDGGRGRC